MPIHPHFRQRRAGVLMHLTSLPDGGRSLATAKQFVDWLANAGFTWWQMLPVGPPGPGNSPYSSPSAFAGDANLLADAELDGNFQAFLNDEAYWLQDWVGWSCRMAAENAGVAGEGEEGGGTRFVTDPMTVAQQQFRFQLAWQELRNYANKRGIHLLGDIPIFVELGSADVAAHPDLFRLNADGTPEVVTGVPPDCFSDTGQLWGHPHYNWPAHREQNFEWWLQRLQRQLRLFDAVRIDHFIGFHNAWEVDGDAETAMHGHWALAPGAEILTAMQQQYPQGLPLLAEDLGEVTPPVIDLRDRFELPGMRILQNAFYAAESADLPQNCPPNSVTYTGTHDNQTWQGWQSELQEQAVASTDFEEAAQTLARLRLYLQGHETPLDLAFSSGSNLVVVPMQDILGLGADARMNTPATTEGNWQWQVHANALSDDLAAKLRAQIQQADRLR